MKHSRVPVNSALNIRGKLSVNAAHIQQILQGGL